MKKLPESLDDMLLAYLDEKSTPAQRKHIEQLMATDEAVKARFDMLASMDALLHQTEAEQPSRNFAQQVMARLDQYPAPPRRSFTFFHGILLAAGVVVAIALAALVGTGAFDSTATSIDLNQVALPQQVERSLPTFTLSGKLIMNIIVMVNLVLAWVMLDRFFLKPYFQRRMHGAH